MSVLWAHVSLGFQDNNVNLFKSSYSSNAVHINFNVSQKLDEIFVCGKLTEQPVVDTVTL